jgi:hypothetical protein
MLIVLVTTVLIAAPAPSEFPSVTCQLTVRVVLVDVGSSDVERYVTLLRASRYCTTVAAPVSVNTPVVAS